MRPWTRARTSALVVVPLVLAGCSTFSDPSPSTGIDELVVPAPSLDADDFVDTVDNPYFVLDDATFIAGAVPLQQTVEQGPEVSGVSTTAVTAGEATDLYAQDTAGNVWWVGREGEWTAGSDGALAGLVMPAEPRLGDGWRRAQVPGADLRAEVVGLDDDEVQLALYDGADATLATYAEGVGLERVETPTGDVVLSRG